MAKFNRFDYRNKKRGRHKLQSIHKDIRIRELKKSKNTYLQLDQNMLEYSYNKGELLYDEQLKQGDPN